MNKQKNKGLIPINKNDLKIMYTGLPPCQPGVLKRKKA